MGCDHDGAWRNLLDGLEGDDRIVVTIRDGQHVGDYNLNEYADFNFKALAVGWHHLAAVGAIGKTWYYVDAVPIGHIDGQTRGPLGAVGNRGDGHMREAFGVMADLRIFGTAAGQDQVAELA